MFILIILLSVLTAFFSIYLIWFQKRLNYWEKLNVNGPTPELMFGNFRKVLLLQESADIFVKDLYAKFKNEKIVGFYKGFEPGLLLKDLNVIKNVLIKDFNTFTDRHIQVDKKNDIEQHLFNLEGVKWKVLRQNFTPLFTSGKLKKMSPLYEKITVNYEKYIDEKLKKGKTCDVRDLTAKFTLESIGSCAFGIDINSFTDEENIFQKLGDSVVEQSRFKKLIQIVGTYMPTIAKLINIPLLNSGNSNKIKKFFDSFISVLLNEREGKPKVRNDFMDLMIELKEKGTIDRKGDESLPPMAVTKNVILAQAFVFFVGGFETSSSTMAFLLYELAINEKVQEKAHNEILNIYKKNNGEIHYEDLKDLIYLTGCFDEALRKYPLISFLTRVANTNYTISELNITVKKGTQMFIPIWCIQKDEKYFKNPEIFDPERFMPENKAEIPTCAYMPFGDGPRNCIGMRFAKVQSLYALSVLLRKYKFAPSSKTPETITFNPFTPILSPIGGIWLDITTRNDI